MLKHLKCLPPELTDTRREEVAALLPCSLSSYVLLKRLPWRRAYIPSRSAAQRKCIMCVCACVNGGLLQSLGGRSRDFHGNLGTPTSPSVPRCVTKLGDRTVWRFVLANLSVSILFADEIFTAIVKRKCCLNVCGRMVLAFVFSLIVFTRMNWQFSVEIWGGKKVTVRAYSLRHGAGAVHGAETAAWHSIFDRMQNIICRLGLHLHVQ